MLILATNKGLQICNKQPKYKCVSLVMSWFPEPVLAPAPAHYHWKWDNPALTVACPR